MARGRMDFWGAAGKTWVTTFSGDLGDASYFHITDASNGATVLAITGAVALQEIAGIIKAHLMRNNLPQTAPVTVANTAS